ncbi:hypothetical protein KDA_42210 [Dictyobacter alpinus]|uniref:Uncharacterized protein n=1 Tax=Dictyobacter alpinus TaxID=2014873 RepID=A0A402BBT5_9CHLR|nr:hypothetical protein [Dictyobacter alpinus]GCE28737.1 hypothetical protein KDA_42210 [Dictyobacter alpinus]
MAQTTAAIPRSAIRGISSGMIFMAIFSTLWAAIGIGGLQGWGGIWPWVLVVLIALGLLAGAFSLIRSARSLPEQTTEANEQRGKRMNMWFMIIFAAEGILIFMASIICNAVLHRFDLFFPIMAIIVGLHFFPLAPLFHMKSYYLVGAILCVLGLLALFVLPAHAQLGTYQINLQWVVLGFGAALVLWGVGFIGLLLLGRRVLAPINAAVQ